MTVGAKVFAYSGRPFSVTNTQLPTQIYGSFGGTIYADLLDSALSASTAVRPT